MVKIKTDKKSKGSKKVLTTGKGPDWYRHEVVWLKDVTSEDSNAKLDIKQIYVFAPTEKQAEVGIVAKVGIRMNFCFLKATIFHNEKHDTVSFIIDGSEKYETADGETKWFHPYDVDLAVKAQVLRYVEAWLEDEE